MNQLLYMSLLLFMGAELLNLSKRWQDKQSVTGFRFIAVVLGLSYYVGLIVNLIIS